MGRGGWMRWALAISLAANLLVAGLVAGMALRGWPPGAGTPEGPGLVAYARALPGDHRRALMQEMRGDQRAWAEARSAMADAGEAFRAALLADPFEAERARQALATHRSAQSELAQRASALLLARLDLMSAEERADFAARLERRGEGRGPGRRERARP